MGKMTLWSGKQINFYQKQMNLVSLLWFFIILCGQQPHFPSVWRGICGEPFFWEVKGELFAFNNFLKYHQV